MIDGDWERCPQSSDGAAVVQSVLQVRPVVFEISEVACYSLNSEVKMKKQCMHPGFVATVQYIFGAGKIFLLIVNLLLIGQNFYRKTAALK